MNTLTQELQSPKSTLNQFKDTTLRVLNYLPEVLTEESEFSGYVICSSKIAGTKKSIRPFRKSLFIRDSKTFEKKYMRFNKILKKLIKGDRKFEEEDYKIVDSVVYTIQQTLGIGLDLMVESNSARKHVGNRFEELIRTLFDTLGISFKKVVLSIPNETDEGLKYYKCETDVIISPYEKVKSDSRSIDKNELALSL